MNDEYTYEEELKLSADRDAFDKYRFNGREEDRIYETESGSRFVNSMMNVKDLNFVKNAKKA